MARETFIAYKYSEATSLRDSIIAKLGDHSSYYKGETAESPDLTGNSVHTIKESLKNMIFGTSVTIVIISPNLRDSKWVDWEIEYSLKEYKRGDTTSRTNGILGVIMKVNGNYDWLLYRNTNSDGCTSRNFHDYKLYEIVKQNRFNLNITNKYTCPVCRTFDALLGSYIALVEEDKFLINPDFYIEQAYEKSKIIGQYNLSKCR